jgi:predicted nucleotidyltransferase
MSNESISHLDLDGILVKTIGLEDLIRVKKHIRRPKDQESLLQLLAIRKAREDTGLR